MKLERNGFSMLTIGGALISLSIVAQAQSGFTAPPGWTQSKAGTTLVWTRGASKLKLSAPAKTQDTRAFFQNQIAKDASYRGVLRKKGEITRSDNGGYSSIYTFATAIVAYGAFTRSDGSRFVALSSPDFATLKNDLPALKNIATQLQRNSATNTRPASTPPKSATTTVKTAYQGVPGKKYLSQSQIVGVYLNESYNVGVGGMVILEYEPVMLLRDGTAYQDFEVPPTELNVASFKKAHPKSWGRWKKTAQGFNVTFNGDKSPSEIKASFKVKPASAGQKLSGTFTTIGGGGNTAMGGNVMVAYSNVFHFDRNGRFSGERSGGGSSASVTVSSSSKNAGIYSVSGNTLRLQYNNGQVVRKLFYFYPDKDKSDTLVLGIGSSAYIEQK